MLLCAEHVVPVTSASLRDAAILVQDGKIVDIGSIEHLRLLYPDEEVRDFGHAILMPGLVDLHTHLEDSVMRGMVRDVPYAEWIESTHGMLARMDSDDLHASAILGGFEMLMHGVTCLADIASSDGPFRAMKSIGLRGVVYREVSATDGRRVDHAMRMAQEEIETWRRDEGRLRIGIAPGPMYVCHPRVYSCIAEYAARENLPVAMHLAGSFEEYEFVKRGSSTFSLEGDANRGYVEIPPWMPTGVSPIRYVLNWGGFECDQLLAVHCVHLDEGDVNKLLQYNVSVASCPRCNAQLNMGAAPLNAFLRAGLTVGLGTDSPAATDSADMIEEMRLGMLIQRAMHPRSVLNAQKMLEMATINGARALGLDDRIGSLEIGKRADVIAVDLADSVSSVASDPASMLVNSCAGSDVAMTMIDGEILYERDKWRVDVEFAKSVARAIGIRGKLGK